MATDLRRAVPRNPPLVSRLLAGPVAALLHRLGVRAPAEARGAEEREIQVLLEEGTRSGVFAEAQRRIVERVFRLHDHRASELMTPMSGVVWLDINDPPDVNRRKIAGSPHNRFPVCDGSVDDVLGVVEVKDLLDHAFAGEPFGVKGLLKMPHLIYEGTLGLTVLEMFKKSGVHVAVVLDEFGAVRGLLTMTDLVKAIVGDMPGGGDPTGPGSVRREDGSWLLDGLLNFEEFRRLVGIDRPPGRDVQTLAGFVVALVGRLPAAGDRVEWGAHVYEVVRMDGRRVDRVRVAPRDPPQTGRNGAL